jgi:hypothetical protein
MNNGNQFKSELILKIHRVLSDRGDWMPAIQDVASHDIDPMWVAGVAYLIIDRYVNSIEESKQIKFYEDVISWFERMTNENNNASGYIEKMKLPKSMN